VIVIAGKEAAREISCGTSTSQNGTPTADP